METPFSVFDEGALTPNDAFFLRYHLADIPLKIDPDSFRVEIKGKVATPLSLSLADLKTDFEQVDLVSLNQCSATAAEWSSHALPAANFTKAPWATRAGAACRSRPYLTGAVQVAFGVLDGATIPETPDFEKSLDIDHARDGDVILA